MGAGGGGSPCSVSSSHSSALIKSPRVHLGIWVGHLDRDISGCGLPRITPEKQKAA